MQAQDFITALGQEINTELTLNEQGTLIITLDDIPILVQWYALDQVFRVQVPIAEAHREHSLEIFTKLLAANFLAIETNGAFFSYAPDINFILLESSIMTKGLDAKEFIKRFEFIIQNADEWIMRIDTWNEALEKNIKQNLDEIKQSLENTQEDNIDVRDYMKV